MVKGTSRVMGRRASPGSLKRAVKAVLDAQRELKYQTALVDTAASVSGSVHELTQKIIQGDSSTTRDGSQINLAKLLVRFEALLTSATVSDFVRLIIFVDTQNNGVAPTVAELLVTADPNSNLSANVLVFKRFRILVDKTFSMSADGNSRAIQYIHDVNTRGTKVSYLGTTDAAASNGKNSFWALVVSDSSATPSTFVLDVGMLFHDS